MSVNIHLSDEQLKYYAGIYKISETDSLIILLKDQQLYFQIQEDVRTKISPISDTVFITEGGEIKIEFNKNSFGVFDFLHFHHKDKPIIAKRVTPETEEENLKSRVISFGVFFSIVLALIGIFFIAKPYMTESLTKGCDADKISSCVWLSRLEALTLNQDSLKHAKKAGQLKIKYHLDEFVEKCGINDYRSCVNAGLHEKENKQIDRAITFFKKACDSNFYLGCWELSLIYVRAGDATTATSYQKKLCKNNQWKGCHELGKRALRHNRSEAFDLFTKTCKLSGNVGCLELGNLMIAKSGFESAKPLFSKACRDNVGNACFRLTVVSNYQRYNDGCKHDMWHDCYYLSIMDLSENLKASSIKHKLMAHEALLKECESKQECINKYFNKACQKGFQFACSAVENNLYQKIF